ncbi:hypothetical protein GPY51_22670 [Photorhabdus laumondii subsp. laumondii]|uniref:Uncharacterized protein n=1 Tax=Photorhabdus laumondii subsp. laumondii TaxID=141679 RepID=A0A6L9JQA9_PHOLM|nr:MULTISPECIES: hypothetical protein [Photorhabdus]MCC8385970.1 hypothetical protein [Photorhabdus laumondii]MCC8388221.1 hypothetical protein [Photorhabdus laumondii]MCC8414981.1 hypothetical protein [Photorhabdus laumondii]NDK97101.1 hypothetical protein [Photorhabdus laumondii subsp. laumondii]NDL15552.1 hypothetical protein [Photorhabdus laumondii subsp. laumondii]
MSHTSNPLLSNAKSDTHAVTCLMEKEDSIAEIGAGLKLALSRCTS